jgi:rhodanese-related sulfurtransferase
MLSYGYLQSSSLNPYSLYSIGKWYSSTGTNIIRNTKASKLIKKGLIKHVIDVRSESEWSEGHYANATLLSIPDMNESSLKKNKINKSDNILLYCNSGRRARYASDILKSFGYKDVYYIESDYHSLPKNIRGEICIASSSCSQSLTA